MINLEKMSSLRPAFAKDGTVTAATSSKISDGAAATVHHERRKGRRTGRHTAGDHRRPCHASRRSPAWFTTAPVGAIAKLLKKAGWSVR